MGNPDAVAFRCRGRPLCLPIWIAPAAALKKGPLRAAEIWLNRGNLHALPETQMYQGNPTQ